MARSSLDAFLGAAPRVQRVALKALLSLAARPRGAALLRRAGPLSQLASALAGLGRYDDPAVASALGWDAETVVARGRTLRREEGRP